MQRKQFLKLSLSATAAFTLQNSFGNLLLDDAWSNKKLKSFGIQLWSVRDDMAKDAKGTLKALASYGYKQIESFDGAQGMWWGMKPQEFKQYLTDNGMTIHSSHCGVDKEFDKKTDEAAAMGMQYLIYPWEGPTKTMDDYKRLADEFNKKGELCKQKGLRFAFHNHDYTFKLMEGKYAQDVLMQNTEASLVDYQMDIYWVVTAGQNPIEWIKKYPNRFKLSHVKDRGIGATTTDASCILGTGQIDFKKILKVAKRNGMQYFNVEQEKWEGSTPLASAAANASYMKKINF